MVEIQKPPKNIDPAVYNYLYQLAEFLSMRIDTVEEHAAVATERAKSVSQAFSNSDSSEYQALRSLIIKTADVVKVHESLNIASKELDNLYATMQSDYVASSQFGTYLQNLNGSIELGSEGMEQYYNFVSQLKANVDTVTAEFDSYRTEAEGYIRTGIVAYDEDNGSPIFGMAVGRNLEVTKTQEVDGVTYDVVNQKDFRALYTDSGLSFWQDSTKVAYMNNNQLYITDVVALNSLTVGKWQVDTEKGFAVKWIGGLTNGNESNA